MDKLFVILLMILLICFKTQAQSSLPKCKGTDFSKWTDCFGSEIFYDGKTYVGEYEMGVPNGQGTETWPNGEQYVGQWYMGSKHGQGTHTLANKDQYVGKFKVNQYHGQGTFIRSDDGLKYVGQWKDNLLHGQGTFIYVNGTIDKGIWEFDELIERQ